MRFTFPLLFGLWVLYTFSSCTSLISSLRAESAAIDEEAERDRGESTDSLVQGYKPKTLRGLSANNVAEYGEQGARAYGRVAEEAQEEGRRVTRRDFMDRDARENSLWDGQGQSNYLFSNNRRREPGDMITADVEKDLRREIQYQLWLTLPPEQRRIKRAPATAAAKEIASAVGAGGEKVAEKALEAKAKDAAEEAAQANMASAGKEDDIIRMEVVESLGNGLVRVLGQKRVVYKGVTRLVEVAALVNNKDVDDGNRVKSGSFLDTKAQVIQ